MAQEINVIDLGGVNCFLIKTSAGFVLIDTGFASKRAELDQALDRAGCRPGNLSLIILTHGDSDHADNANYLKKKLGGKITIHADDAGMVEKGDMSFNRKPHPDKSALIFGMMTRIIPLFVKSSPFEVFTPDFLITEDTSLAEFGFEGRVVRLPGHSKGSIGILTPAGDLFCGDLIYNLFGKPSCNYIDDLAAYNSSIEKLKKLPVKIIYPGHGKPFSSVKYFGS